jgi:anthranilate phosphoribosyltransferase
MAPAAFGVDLDWPSYADRHKQLPYFVLAARLLAGAGVRVLMHGIEGEGPVTTPKALTALGITPARSLAEAKRQLDATRFAYMSLHTLCPLLDELFHLRPLLGLRSPVNSLARELNPFEAAHQIQGVFHPTYLPLHQEAARLLGQPRAVIFKGGGGEGQRNPDKPCHAVTLDRDTCGEQTWPALTEAPYSWRKEPLEPARLAALWRGEWTEPGPVAAVVGTTAMALHMLGRTATPGEAEDKAAAFWRDRPPLA